MDSGDKEVKFGEEFRVSRSGAAGFHLEYIRGLLSAKLLFN
jgi:hypothetical protein